MTPALMLLRLAADTTPQSATDQLLGQGLLGVCVLALAAVIVFLQRRNDALRAQIDALNELRLKDRDLRLEDQKANAKVMLEVSDRYKETITLFQPTAEELKDELKSLQAKRGPYR